MALLRKDRRECDGEEKRREEKKRRKLKGTWEMIGAGLIGFSLRRNRATGGMRRTCGLI